jgi:biopolymer transport protein TolR
MVTRSEKKKLMVDINITPFTDVVLVLLIIFMVATPLIYQKNLKINLPQAKAAQSEEKPQKVVVSINEEGDIYIDDVKYNMNSDEEKIKSKILTTAGTSAESTIMVNADRNCKYDSVIGIIDMAKEIGVKRIMLGAEVKK